MIRKILLNCYQQGQNLFEKTIEIYKHWAEYNKLKDSRRVAISSKIQLTKEQKQAIDEFYLKNYGKKIPYTWHRHYTAFTGKFDLNYFPDLLFHPEFERFMNYRGSYREALSDKNLLSVIAKTANVVMPKSFLTCTEGLFKDASHNILSREEFLQKFGKIGEVFIKPTCGTSSGISCAVVKMQNERDLLSGKTVEEIIDRLGNNFTIQERLVCHQSLKAIYPYSVNTFRIVTYRWNNKIYHMPLILRIGQGGNNVDNAHAGGVFIAVEDNGKLHKTAFTEFNRKYTEHPDTHVKFDGYAIPNVEKIIEAARRLHTLLPQLGCYNWDFTLNELGQPVLIEVNTDNGAVWVLQMAHSKGVFGERTGEILQWLAKMKKMSYSTRKDYLYEYLVKQNKNHKQI